MNRKLSLLFIAFVCFVSSISITSAQTKPFILPMAMPPGPSTWLLGQPYGNTTGAFNRAQEWYSAGQGLHFGLDFPMPCGTELIAVADGEVAFVDNLGFGAGPHNLLIRHPNVGVITLYGHLLTTPSLVQGQAVKQGDFVGYSGDPDVVCDSRPHLHFEVRSMDYFTAYNPIPYIEADWHALAAIGSFGGSFFEQDLDNSRRWMSLEDQPDVAFGGFQLNAYAAPWPPHSEFRPPTNPLLKIETPPFSPDSTWSLRQLGYTSCCPQPRWHPSDSNRLYVIDGIMGQRANVVEWDIATGPSVIVNTAPPMVLSPDGTHEVSLVNGQAMIRRLLDSATWPVPTGGVMPAVSTDNGQLLWEVQSGASIPGQAQPSLEVWVSNITGENTRQLVAQVGGSAVWLDATRILVTTPLPENRITVMTVYDTTANTAYELGRWAWMRGLTVSPGGERLMFYLAWNDDPTLNGVHVIETQPGAQVQRLTWFGSWRWRDSDSVYYMPLGEHRLIHYNLLTGEENTLTDVPIRVANGDWSVSPDGRRIIFQNVDDLTMWLLEDLGA